MSLKPYYDILGLPATASSVEVRKQYRKLAMSLHPDKNPSPEAKERFIRITDAYEILCGKKEGPFTSRMNCIFKVYSKGTNGRSFVYPLYRE